MGDLLTLVQSKLPVKIVVFNNSSLNFVELEMKAAGFVTFATDLSNPNFADVATALGIRGFRVENSEDLPAALDDALDHDGPALIDVVTARQELSMPPSITAAAGQGVRALCRSAPSFPDKGDELLDLAATNWRQLF